MMEREWSKESKMRFEGGIVDVGMRIPTIDRKNLWAWLFRYRFLGRVLRGSDTSDRCRWFYPRFHFQRGHYFCIAILAAIPRTSTEWVYKDRSRWPDDQMSNALMRLEMKACMHAKSHFIYIYNYRVIRRRWIDKTEIFTITWSCFVLESFVPQKNWMNTEWALLATMAFILS